MAVTSFSNSEIMILATGFQKSRIILTAVELDIFSIIRSGGKSIMEISEAVSGNPKATERLLEALCAIGLLVKKDNLYFNTDSSEKYLVKGMPEYLGGLNHQAHLWHSWTNLTSIVRQGQGTGILSSSLANADWSRAFIAAMQARGMARAKIIATMLNLNHAKLMLDLGGGSGVFAAAILEKNENMHAVVFDLPEIVPITQEYFAQFRSGSRMKTIADDYHRDDIGQDYDLIFMSAVIHSNSFEENAKLIAKCARSLNKNGQLIIVDYVMDESRIEPATGAMFAINMLVGTDGGDTFTENEIKEWFHSAGLLHRYTQRLEDGNSIVTAYKN